MIETIGESVCMWEKTRVSYETLFISKQLKLETKLVLALSEQRGQFWLFHKIAIVLEFRLNRN
jgi:hypothetical protein